MREFKIDGFVFRQVGSVKSGPCAAHKIAPQHEWLGRDEATGIWAVVHEHPVMWGEPPYTTNDFRGSYETHAEPFRVEEDYQWLKTIGEWLVRGWNPRPDDPDRWTADELTREFLCSPQTKVIKPGMIFDDGRNILTYLREEVIVGARVTFKYFRVTWDPTRDWHS
jgi:hypothetical protein